MIIIDYSQVPLMRLPQIDLFRGLCICLMVFFTLSYWLSANIPDILKHNESGSLHLGDFVLPMFLFASGMSLVFFQEKREGKKRSEYWLDVIERFGKLAIISIALSFFSAGSLFGMDEVMLSALLFLATMLLLQLPEIYMVSISLAIPSAYALITAYTGLLPDFGAAYLGGYPAAIFYLPVMLTGVMMGRRLGTGKTSWIAIAAMAGYLVYALVVPPYKDIASPSFMALSIVVSIAVFEAVKGFRNRYLEYLGTKPIRYWVLMFVIILIPLAFLSVGSRTKMPFSGVPAWLGVLYGLISIAGLYIISRALDRIRWLAI